MDAILKKAKRAQGGDSEALKELKLDSLDDPQLSARSTKNTTKSMIETQFETVTRVRYAAHHFNLRNLEECAESLQSMLIFIASFKFKKKLQFMPETEHVIRCMGTLAEQWRKWFESVNDKEREGICNELCNLLARAVQGEADVIEQLGMDELTQLPVRPMKDVQKKSSLKAMAFWATELYKCSLYVKDDVLKCVCHGILGYLGWIAEEAYPKYKDIWSVKIAGDQTLNSVIYYLQEVEKIVIKAEVLLREERMARTEEEVEEIELEQQDPTYALPSESDTEPEELAPSLASGSSCLEEERKPTTSKKRKRDEEEVFWTTKKTKQSTSDDNESETEKKANSSSRKRSHHATRCPVCNKQNTDLRRQLDSHVRKGLIKKESVGIILSVPVNKARTRGHARSAGNKQKTKGLKLKWCPVEGCHTVTHLLRSHLQKFHRVKAGVSLEKYLNLAAEYKGKQEVDHLSTELLARSSTSTAHTSTVASPSPPPLPSKSISSNVIEQSSCEEEEYHYPHRQAFYTDQRPRSDRHTQMAYSIL